MSFIGWVKEWGIFTAGESMSLLDRLRWFRQWVPFGLRTIFFGTISLLIGPFTPRRWVSAWAMRRWSQTAMRGLSITYEIEGAGNVPAQPGGAWVYASNHQSLLDIIALGAALPGEFKWAAKRSLMVIPFLGWHLRLAGHVAVDRGRGPAAAAAAVDRFCRVLNRGFPLLVFPEGTRSKSGRTASFKDGGFIAAIRSGVPVVPVAIAGTGNLMGKDAVDTGPSNEKAGMPMRHVRIKLGSPIAVPDSGSEETKLAYLREESRRVVLRMRAELGDPTARTDTIGGAVPSFS